jgi:antitoxin (DNA-binding transcriptional repressor) of toxin-antitoxin stability system
MSTVTLEETQSRLPELIGCLHAEESVVITRDERPVARLLTEDAPARKPRKAGNCAGLLFILADDHDHLAGFAEHVK